ncbi:MAG TPA: Fe-S cluster assembly protein SufD [Caulobacteraceae bacterium]|jgi:Fe-S cluster assembly protein SufD
MSSLARAIETGDLAELPSRRDEDWRWTDLRGLIRELPAPAGRGEVWGPGVFSQVSADERVEIVNGRGAAELMLTGGVLELRLIADGAGASSARLRLVVEAAGSVLLETHEASAGAVASHELMIDLEPGASVERVVIVETEADAVLVSVARVSLGAGARFSQTVITDGSRRQRTETRVAHPGEGAAVRLDGVYLLADQRHADITTVVSHAGMDGTTDQLTKGVVRDQGRGVFQGRIVVRPGADKTDARMGHHALVLSDRAEVDAKPELEIFADDVACAHGNTVGALNEDALFYAEQRGIPEADAKAMLTEAFVGEVVDRIEHEGARDVVRAWVAERLRGSDQ